ncbi:MAG: VWA domain-containing protein [Burkholderiales bacterium]
MIELAWPLALAALVLPFVAARCLPPAAPVAAPLRVPFLDAARGWQSAAARSRPRTPAVLALVAWAMLVAAACRPQWIGDPVAVPMSGRSLVLALDLSASMRTPTTGGDTSISVMRRTARRFVEGRTGDRVGLIVLGTRAYVQAPPSPDLRAVAQMVDETFIGLAGEGTALGDAIALGVARLRASPAGERVLVLLTDGAQTDGRMTMEDAARLARRHGVRVHAVGIGEPPTARQQPGEGLDEEALRSVAAETGGRYYRAGTPGALVRIYAELDRAEPIAREARELRPAVELYPWALGAALLLAAIAALSAWRRR